MTFYRDTIKADIHSDDDDLAALVEELMRGEYSTLDHLSPVSFRRAAQQAAKDAYLWACAPVHDTTLATYCEIMGLAFPASLSINEPVS